MGHMLEAEQWKKGLVTGMPGGEEAGRWQCPGPVPAPMGRYHV